MLHDGAAKFEGGFGRILESAYFAVTKSNHTGENFEMAAHYVAVTAAPLTNSTPPSTVSLFRSSANTNISQSQRNDIDKLFAKLREVRLPPRIIMASETTLPSNTESLTEVVTGTVIERASYTV